LFHGKRNGDSLRSRDEPVNDEKASDVRVFVENDIWLESGREYVIQCKVGEQQQWAHSALFLPRADNLERRNIFGAYAIVNASDGYCPVRMWCLSEQRMRLFKGTCLGTLEPYVEDRGLCYQMVETNDCNAEGKLAEIFSAQIQALPKDESEKLKKILSEFRDVFSQSKFDIGLSHAVQHHIDTGSAQPIAQNYRRVPKGVEGKVDELVEELLKNDIIRPSCSAWNSPIVVVAKKNGDIRLCIDYRRLNSVTKRPIFPIPEPQQLFDALEGACWFSTLDLSQGYYQVPVAEKDISKTAFATRRGQYEYLRMPMGLCSAPSTFQRLMHAVLQKENWVKCLIYLDDVLIFGRTAQEHYERLHEVLTSIRKSGLKLSPQKCELFQQEVTYLGHVISRHGIHTSPEKTDKIKNASSPKNEEELRSFLGLTGYYRRFIKDYATIVAPLEKLCLSTWSKITSSLN
jgi:hypothetical protein